MYNIVTKGWGYEIWIENNEFYCGKHLHVLPYKKCSVHYHKDKLETFYVINGELELTYSNNIKNLILELRSLAKTSELSISDRLVSCWINQQRIEQKTVILKKGDCFTLPQYTPHTFTSNTAYPCDFIEFSTHHEDSDSYRIIKGD